MEQNTEQNTENMTTEEFNNLSPMDKVIHQENEPVLYDADAVQRYPHLIDGETETTHIYAPMTDERFFEYDRAAGLKLVDDGQSILPDNSKALVKLFDDLVTGLENDSRGMPPADWKDQLDADKEKIPSVTTFLAVAAFSEKSGGWGQPDNTVMTESYFNYEITRQKHFLRRKTTEDVRDFSRFKKIPLASKAKGLRASETALPSNAQGKAQLYDRMMLKSAEGYAGRTPAAHKAAVIDFIFASGLSQKK